MSNFIGGFITGAIVGTVTGVYITKNKKEASVSPKIDPNNDIYIENERFSKRNKEMSREIEDLQYENRKLRKSIDAKYDDQDDLESDLSKIKREVKQLQSENNKLLLELKEYKAACEGYELEIARLKK